MLLEQAHFLRPWWLLLLITIPFILLAKHKFKSSSAWRNFVDPHLLPYITERQPKAFKAISQKLITSIFIFLLSFALAGPTIHKIPNSSHLIKKPLVILLELSPHMLSNDLSPSRLKRALYKLKDFLQTQKGREVALIAFAGDAHVVAPLTDDHKTIIALSESLSPAIMPIAGSSLLDALERAKSMGDNNILVISSSNLSDQPQALKNYINANFSDLTFWWFATKNGAPMVNENGSFTKNKDGTIIMSHLQEEYINNLLGLKINSYNFTPSDIDIKTIASHLENNMLAKGLEDNKYYDSWVDLGPYVLACAMLLFLAMSLIEGPQWFILGLFFLMPFKPTHAAWYDNFLKRPDQQAYEALIENKPEKAAELYQDNFSKGTSFYKAKNFEKAVEYLQKATTPDALYNLGNAYAQLGKIKEAIDAYNQALKLNPDNHDAQYNKELLEKLQDKQEQNKQKQDKQNQDKQEQNKQEEDKQNQDKQEQNKQEEDKQNQDKQEQNKQEENKQNQPNQDQNKQEQDKQNQDKQENNKQEEEKQNQDKHELNKQEQKKQAQPAAESSDKDEKLDNNTRYYLDHLERHNNLYLKRKFSRESQQKQEGRR